MITREQKIKICEMTVAKIPQKEIMKKLGLSKFQVRHEQKRAGMQMHRRVTVSPETETKILGLLQQGHGQPYVARELGLKPHVVYAIMRKHNYRKPRGSYGAKYNLSKKKLAKIRRDIRDSERKIAKKNGVSHEWLRKFRLKMWDCVGDNHWKRRKQRTSEDPQHFTAVSFAALAERIVARYEHLMADADDADELSQDERADILCSATVEGIPELRSASNAARDHFGGQLRTALLARLADARNSQRVN